MLKYFSAAIVAATLFAAPTLSAGAAQPAGTLITKPVADYGVTPKPKGYGTYRHYKKHKKHMRHYGRAKVKDGYRPAPKPYKPAPAKSGY